MDSHDPSASSSASGHVDSDHNSRITQEDEQEALDRIICQRDDEYHIVSDPVNNDLLRELPDFPIPRGYRLSPREPDLINHYMRNHILGRALPCNTIRLIEDLYNFDPQELPIGKSNHFLPNEIYYFTRHEGAYADQRATSLDTKSGCWRARGGGKKIWQEEEEIGFRRTYMFYEGKDSEAKRTPWIMHEYRINPKVVPQCSITDHVRTEMGRLVACKIIYIPRRMMLDAERD